MYDKEELVQSVGLCTVMSRGGVGDRCIAQIAWVLSFALAGLHPPWSLRKAESHGDLLREGYTRLRTWTC